VASLYVSHRNHVIALRPSLIGNCCLLYDILLKLTFEQCIDAVVTAILGVIFGIDKFCRPIGVQAFI